MKHRKLTAILLVSLTVSCFFLFFFLTFSSDPDRSLRETIRGENSDNRETTIAQLDEILRRWPRHVNTLEERISYSRSDEESLKLLARIQDGPPFKVAQARFKEGNILLQKNRCRDAVLAFQEALKMSPERVEVRQRLIPWLALMRRAGDVRTQLQGLRESRGLTLAEMALWITADGRLTPFSEAEVYLKGFIAADPSDVESLRAFCIYLAEESRQDEAIQLLKNALKSSPGNEELSSLLSQFYLNSLDLPNADQILSAIEPTASLSTDTWSALGQMAFCLKDFQAAKIATEYAASKTPFERSRAYQLFRVLTALGKDDEGKVWRQRSELLNALHSEMETLGIAVSRRIMDAHLVTRIAELLLQLNRPAEAGEWIAMARSMSQANSSVDLPLLDQLSAQCALMEGSFLSDLEAPVAEWNSTKRLRLESVASEANPAPTSSGSSIMFADRASLLGIDMQYENGQTGLKYLVEAMGGGVLAFDADHDGWTDLYCPQGGSLGVGPQLTPLSDSLLRNRRGLTFTAVTEEAEIQAAGYSLGGAVGDFNSDGFDDVFVANVGRNSLLLNLGDGTFEDVTSQTDLANTSAMSSSAAFADLDGDSDLDLYVVNYVDGLKICRNDKQQVATCNPASHAAAPDELFENLGDGRFVDRSEVINPEGVTGKGLGVVISRLNSDLRPDVFVSNDTTPNLLFLNQTDAQKLIFEEQGFATGVAVNGVGQVHAGMGIACADLDRDLRPDLYVTNFHREANSLFLQKDPGLFQDMTTSAGLREPTLPRLGFGTQAVDFDLDGWVELFVTNGHIDDQTELGVEWQMAPQLFKTSNGQHWSDVSSQSGPFMQEKWLGRGVAVLDADRDGRPDLAIGFQDRPLALLRNETETCGNSIMLQLSGGVSNRSAINAVVYWDVNGQRMMAEICGGNGYLCSNERKLTLGLGNSEAADVVEIHWQDGQVQRQHHVARGQFLVREGKPFLIDPL